MLFIMVLVRMPCIVLRTFCFSNELRGAFKATSISFWKHYVNAVAWEQKCAPAGGYSAELYS